MTGDTKIPRRRALRILAAGLAVPLGVLGLRQLQGATAPVRWHGEVLGAVSAMTIWHPNAKVAERAVTRLLHEIDRLESIFSLYRTSSEIAQLNRDGALERPSADLVHVLDQSQRIAVASDGAFDPTIQPLWRLYELGQGPNGNPVSDRALEHALSLVDHQAIHADGRAVRFARPGMAISLNGIAQGYITDRITDILGNDGFENAMIELGETRALGAATDGQPFAVGLIDPRAPDMIERVVPLENAALAVSGGYGLRFDRPGQHHIFEPGTGHSANKLIQVAVVSPRAIWADALSTAIYVAGEARATRLLAVYPGSRAILTRPDGTTVEM